MSYVNEPIIDNHILKRFAFTINMQMDVRQNQFSNIKIHTHTVLSFCLSHKLKTQTHSNENWFEQENKI